MNEPSKPLAKAVRAAIIAANAIPATKVMTRIPAGTSLPYVEVGHDQIVGEDDAGAFFRAYVEVQAFAATTDAVKTLVSAIYDALYVDLEMEGFSCHEHHYDGTLFNPVPSADDKVERAVMSFEYLIQKVQ
jgi:hypothetical protein